MNVFGEVLLGRKKSKFWKKVIYIDVDIFQSILICNYISIEINMLMLHRKMPQILCGS